MIPNLGFITPPTQIFACPQVNLKINSSIRMPQIVLYKTQHECTLKGSSYI